MTRHLPTAECKKISKKSRRYKVAVFSLLTGSLNFAGRKSNGRGAPLIHAINRKLTSARLTKSNIDLQQHIYLAEDVDKDAPVRLEGKSGSQSVSIDKAKL